MDLSAATWACDRLEGIAWGFVQNGKGNTANHVRGAVQLAPRKAFVLLPRRYGSRSPGDRIHADK